MIKKFTFLTLFPENISQYLNTSVIAKIFNKKLFEYQIIDIRKYTTNQSNHVDDYQYGGQAGMVIKPEPVYLALKENNLLNEHIILLSPRGKTWKQAQAQNYACNSIEHFVFLCGHYEGFDERINQFVSEYISVGDYVLTSGELSALVVFDAIVRLIPGAINNQSLVNESFNNYLLDHPVYTRPFVFLKQSVPEILRSGHHKKILEYQLNERIRLTKKYRPDLYQLYLKNKK